MTHHATVPIEALPAGSVALPWPLSELARRIKGRVQADRLHRVIYATDASSCREIPMGVVVPVDVDDLKAVVACRAGASGGAELTTLFRCRAKRNAAFSSGFCGDNHAS
jgi:hypothetical protein